MCKEVTGYLLLVICNFFIILFYSILFYSGWQQPHG
jgi:hypothetical protein